MYENKPLLDSNSNSVEHLQCTRYYAKKYSKFLAVLHIKKLRLRKQEPYLARSSSRIRTGFYSRAFVLNYYVGKISTGKRM